MPVTDEYLEYVLDQLRTFGEVTYRKMFGGIGLYLLGKFFALIADDVLYFKVDDDNRNDYEQASMEPFKPFPDKPQTMQYYEVPIDVLENRDNLKPWADKAYAVAVRKAKKTKKK
ncbi:MAG: TfoX/Sxy family protein [Anaerohalosphaera sp.]|nr:TfoX/Sxy family protein [Anaerohalosphaera sp.]